jgi:hypothetical protein
MTVKFGVAARNNMGEAYEAACNGQTVAGGTGAGASVTGTAAQPKLRILTGSEPAGPASAQTGTLLVEMTLPADWVSAASSGVKSLSGTWQATAAAAGTAGYYRIVSNDGTVCHEQGTVTQAVVIATSALTAANSNVLNFASTTGVVVGMNVVGTGIVDDATVLALTGTTVTMSHATVAGVASAASITFRGDIALDNTNIANGQTVTITAKTLTMPGA